MRSGKWKICLFLRIIDRLLMSVQLPITDSKIVENIIPQKFPFVMVGGLLSWNSENLKSEFLVEKDNILVHDGYFQASGVLEHQAQSVALHTGYHFFLKNETPPVGYIGAVKFFNIAFLPKIGDKIVTEVRILNEMMGVTLVSIESKVDGKLLATSEMKTVIKD